MSYWDTSTLAKLYIPEADSPVFEQKADIQPVIVTSKLALYEARRVAFRKESDGFIKPGTAELVMAELEQDLATGEIHIIELDGQVEARFNTIMTSCYRRSPCVPIRTLDALHLASAQAAGETEIVVTAKRFREAAKVLGLSLFPT